MKKMIFNIVVLLLFSMFPLLAAANPGAFLITVPETLDFGEVELGDVSTLEVTLVVSDGVSAIVSQLIFQAGSSDAFSVMQPVPFAVAPGDVFELTVAFSPVDAGEHQGVLEIHSDADNALVTVVLAGVGISASQPITIEDILAFFDQSVDNGTLQGRGRRPNLAALRLKAMRKLFEVATCLIESDLLEEACFILERAYLRSDGSPWPWDFVVGEARAELNEMILQLMSNMDCE